MKKIIMTAAVILAFPAAVHGQGNDSMDKGDTFSKISESFNVSYSDCVQAIQNWGSIDIVYPGQELEFPEQEEPSNNNEEAPNEVEAEDGEDQEKADIEEAPEEGSAEAPSEETNTEEAPKEGSAEAPSEETQDENSVEESADEPKAEQKNNSSEDDVQTESEFEQEVISLTNQEREKAGLDPLEPYSELSDVARDKSKDMRDAGYFDHNSPNYGSPFDMMDTYGIEYKGGGENIAAGQRSAEEVVEGWMNSEGHRENILNADFTHIGVGHAEGGSYGDYWTQMFVTK